MKKGQWLINSLRLFLGNTLSLSDVYHLIFARYASKPTTLEFAGLHFSHVDHSLWSAILDVFVNDVYETKRFNIQKEHFIVDIGAHRGAFTIYAAFKLGTKVLAYEPSPENYRILVEQKEKNQLQNITIHQKAIGGSSKGGYLFMADTSSRHSTMSSTGSLSRNHIPVEILSLDDALQGVNTVHFLKMDCEGAEIEILLNASSGTLSKINAIAAETHNPLYIQEMKELQDKLSRHFSNTKFIDQKHDDLGYLFAWN